MIHALLIVHNHYEDRRADRVIRALHRAGLATP
jgi:hypothetical protein